LFNLEVADSLEPETSNLTMELDIGPWIDQCNIVFADPINHLGVVLLKDSLKLMHTVFDMFDCFDAIWRYVDENNIIQELLWVKDRFSLPGWCNLSEKGSCLFFNKGSEPFTNNNFLSRLQLTSVNCQLCYRS
jgi:hypothetical protein